MRLIDADLFDKELKEYSDAHWEGEFYAAEDIRSMLEDAPTVNPYEWISVEDRLPEIDPYGKGRYGGTRSVRVLCVCKQRDGRTFVKEGYYEPCGDGSVCWRIPGSIDSVTHWMPLPTPPIEKEN
jgi:hypothetical protein